MKNYIYTLDWIRVQSKNTLLEFKNNLISFINEDFLWPEEHSTPILLLSIKAHEELWIQEIKRKLDIINWILLILSSTIWTHTNIKLWKMCEIININEASEVYDNERINLFTQIYNIIIWNIKLEEIFMYFWTDISISWLYKITDILKQLWIKENTEIKRLKRTANSSVIWERSRHWLSQTIPPSNPMTDDEWLILMCKSIWEYFYSEHNISIPLIQTSDDYYDF